MGQRLARVAHNHEAAGSNPAPAIIKTQSMDRPCGQRGTGSYSKPRCPLKGINKKVIIMEKNAAEKEQAVKSDIVCPACYKPVAGCTVIGGDEDDYGRQVRHYMGWCCNCNMGFEAVQFLAEHAGNPRWILHRWQYYAMVQALNKNLPQAGWQIVNELPVPAPVVTGPGGEYNESFTPKTVDLIEKLNMVLKSTQRTVDYLIKAIRNGGVF